MVKRRNDAQPLSPPMLLSSKEEASEKITRRIELGHQIKNSNITSMTELKQARTGYYSWNEYNEDLLLHLFDNSSIKEGYRKSFFSVSMHEETLDKQIEDFRDNVDYYLRKLESIRERLEIFEVSPRLIQPPLASQQLTLSKKVFVVHGHDEGAKEAVARFISKLGLQPIILNEQPNSGKTIIEKFEDSAEEVGFAVVLLTPDDMGYPRDKPEELKPRPRQNVVLELGYFLAKLGRSRVCALYKGNVELPSDYDGVIYLKMDSHWQIDLAKEIRQVIKDIDLNKVLA
ncbi:MAG TPA: nucleotide-binding protein [Methylomirabilota bacterium]|nr:nucleotide-binding protein [Methylomirabilota bacterium]